MLCQFGNDGLHRSGRIGLRDSGPEVAEINGGLPMRMRRQSVQHLPNASGPFTASFVVAAFSPIHYAEKGHAGAFQFRTVIELVNVDEFGDALGTFRIAVMRGGYRFKQVVDAAPSKAPWLSPVRHRERQE